MALSEDQIRRYSRHVLLPDVGGVGQERLLAARVAVPVGPGRAANVAALAYLAAAGVGHLVVTGDAEGALGAGEIATGILYAGTDLGRPRIEALRDRIGAQNPDVRVEPGDGPADLDCGEHDDEGPFAVADALARAGDAASRLLAEIASNG